MENNVSAIAKTDFLALVARPDGDNCSYSVLKEVGGRSPAVLIVLPGQEDYGSLVRALEIRALQLVFAGGGEHIPLETLARDEPSPRQPDKTQLANGKSRVPPSDLGLTERQLRVLALVMQGKTNKAISRVLNLAEPTVKNHVGAILRALEVSNRTEAVIAVSKLGWELPTVAES
jgi:DNA-binding NarL/FixJ family response regulator